MWQNWPLWAMRVLGGEMYLAWLVLLYYLDGLLEELL